MNIKSRKKLKYLLNYSNWIPKLDNQNIITLVIYKEWNILNKIFLQIFWNQLIKSKKKIKRNILLKKDLIYCKHFSWGTKPQKN